MDPPELSCAQVAEDGPVAASEHRRHPPASLAELAMPNGIHGAMNAVKASDLDYLKADILIEAGRAYTNAGQKDKAEAVYRQVMKDYPKTTSNVEAEIRLSELTAGQM